MIEFCCWLNYVPSFFANGDASEIGHRRLILAHVRVILVPIMNCDLQGAGQIFASRTRTSCYRTVLPDEIRVLSLVVRLVRNQGKKSGIHRNIPSNRVGEIHTLLIIQFEPWDISARTIIGILSPRIFLSLVQMLAPNWAGSLHLRNSSAIWRS